MSTADVIIIGIIAAILVLAIYKIIKDRKRGIKCPGCGECGAGSRK